MRNTSATGIKEIQRSESLRLTPYKDIAGKWTIGWGHLIKDNEPELLRASGITENQASALLKQDLKTAESAVNRLVTVPLSEGQYDALVSFVYNVGEGNFSESSMLRELNAENYDAAAAQFPRWKYAGGEPSAGLLARRAREQNTFLS